MRILIDGDACSRLATIERIARQKHISCHIYCDASRHIASDYSDIHIADIGSNSADMLLLKYCKNGDIVITNDISLAAMALTKHAFVISNNGTEFTDENIMTKLTAKYICQKTKKPTGRYRRKQTNELLHQTNKQHISFTQTLTTVIARKD